MVGFRRMARGACSMAVAATLIQAPLAVAQEAQSVDSAPQMTLQTSNPVQSDDNRVAQYLAYTSDAEGNEVFAGSCTAEYIGSNTWLTAAHCLTAATDVTVMRLRQNAAEVASVIEHSFVDPNADIMVLHVGDGIQADAFNLPTRELGVGEVATITGYGGQVYATEALYAVQQLFDRGTYYDKVYWTESTTTYQGCPGDSGSPFHKDNTLYGVHSLGESNDTCGDRLGAGGEESRVLPHVDYIKALIAHWEPAPGAAAGPRPTVVESALPYDEPNMNAGYPGVVTPDPTPDTESGSGASSGSSLLSSFGSSI